MKKRYAMKKSVFLSVVIGGTLGLLLAHKAPLSKERISMKYDAQGYKKIDSVATACAIFPKTSEEIIERSHQVQKTVQKHIDELLALDPAKYNQKTVLQALDRLRAEISAEVGILNLVKAVYPYPEIVAAAETEFVALSQFIIEHIDSNPKIYQLLKTYQNGAAQKENLSVEDGYFLQKVIENFELQGLNLPVEKQEQVLALKKKCAELESEFQRFIDQDITTIKVAEEALAGVSEDFKKTLQREGELYVLPMNYPVQTMIMNYCSVEDTRKHYFKAFNNKAHPHNESVLQQIIQVREEIARLLSYESFAAYDLKTQMIKTPERAWDFENSLREKALVAAEKDFNQLVKDLPAGVSLTKEGKLNPWDFIFVSTYFKKKYYSIDEQAFAEYFPMEKTIAGLISIYEKFFNLSIEPVTARSANGSISGRAVAATDLGMWHPDVRLLQVKDKTDGTLLSYIFLDMFPREKKYGHAAAFEEIAATKKEDGARGCSVVTLVCNFTKPTKEKPSLLRYDEVITFFHEFGHAIHVTLGATKYYALAGFNTEIDFIELPSQMLENWMKDKEILTMISSHYLTGKPLPEELIEKRLELLKFGQGLFVIGQLVFGMISLKLFGPSLTESLADTYKYFSEYNNKHIVYDSETHRYCSFGHFMGYGPKYYGYLWSLALAYDVFEHIEKEGLLNPEAGRKYSEAMLSCGGSKDANDMLYNYLGREPRFDAFYRKMGLAQTEETI
jgi:thimet oligopeptidase